jgi:SAM-dependent methyltransferase
MSGRTLEPVRALDPHGRFRRHGRPREAGARLRRRRYPYGHAASIMPNLPKRLAGRIGLLEPARQLRDVLRAWRHQFSEQRDTLPSDGLPIPSSRLILKVAGTPDAGWFLEGGRRAANSITEALSRHSVNITDVRSMLDFGCGCGRVIRHWRTQGGQIHGADYQRAGLEWCRRNLPFARFVVNDVLPPLPYPSEHFSVVYALSVFTHFPQDLQEPWMRELHRVLTPGGCLVFSVHGTAYADELSVSERKAFDSGDLVVRDGAAGSNVCGAYHPEIYIRGVLARGFEVLEIAPSGAAGNPRQDLVVMRKTAAPLDDSSRGTRALERPGTREPS